MATFTAAMLTKAGVSTATAATVGTYAGYAGTAASLLGTYSSYQQQKLAGQQDALAYEQQATQAELKAGEQANIRRERLLKALAAQNLAAGASGAYGGSTDNLQLQSLDEYSKEQKAAGIYSDQVSSAYATKADTATTIGTTKARASLLSGATKFIDAG